MNLSRTYIGSFMVVWRPRTGLIVALNAIVEREWWQLMGEAFSHLSSSWKSLNLVRCRVFESIALSPSLSLSISLLAFLARLAIRILELPSRENPVADHCFQRRGVLDASDRADPVARSLSKEFRDCERRRARVRAYVYTKGSDPRAWRGMTVAGRTEGPS